MSSSRAAWPALESNPEVLTDFIRAVGAPESVAFHDVYGLDNDMLGMVPQPIRAMVLLFPGGERDGQERAGTEQQVGEPFFLWQSKNLGNACGTIASIHALLNSDIKIPPETPLGAFAQRTLEMHPCDRGVALEADETIRSVHAAQAQEGQTDAAGASDDVDYHFVCFVHTGGKLWELDGLKGKPVAHGPSSADGLLKDAARVIQMEFIARRPDMLNFSLLALGPAEQ